MTVPTQDVVPGAPRRSPSAGRTGTGRILLLALVLGAAGLAVGLEIGKVVKRAGSSGLDLESWEKLALVAMWIGLLLLVLLAHELGHLAGGRLVGFRAFLLIVGPLRLERTSHGWRARLNTDMALFGGLAGSAATDTRDLTRRTAIMVAGGPAVSLLLGVGCGVSLLALDLLPLDRTTPFSTVLLFFGLMCVAGTSTAIGLVTLVPLTTSGYLSDGARLLRLIRGGPVAARDGAIQAIVGASLSGVRPRDWDTALLHAALALPDGSTFEFAAWLLAQMHAADAGRAGEALQQLRTLLAHVDRMPPSMTAAIHLDAARQFALAGEMDEARTQLALATGPVIAAPFLRPFAEAAIAAGEGRRADALALVPTIRAQIGQTLDRGGAQWLADTLDGFERAHRA